MKLYLFRHGIALDRTDPKGPPDSERPLTRRGVRRTRRAARGLRALGVRPDAVMSSPLRRAMETARLAAKALRFDEKGIVTTPALEPEQKPDALLSELRKTQSSQVLLVGHAPHLDVFLSRILGREGAVTRLKKAGAACVELEEEGSSGRLVWLLEPRALRALAGKKAGPPPRPVKKEPPRRKTKTAKKTKEAKPAQPAETAVRS